MTTQRVRIVEINDAAQLTRYVPHAVLAGPHHWSISDGGPDYAFSTVLVRTRDTRPKHLSMIDVRTGYRVAQVMCSAPKTRPSAARLLSSAAIDRLRAEYGETEVVRRLRSAKALA